MPDKQTVCVQGVTKTFDTQHALENLTLSVGAGESLALLGHNGAGKTTLMKLVLGLIRPDAGKVRILGVDPAGSGATEIRQNLGYLPENIAFYPALSGAETLAFYARLKRQPVADCARLLDRVGLGDAARKKVGAYSKGMRQRLGLAQALIGNPRVLLLDEPTTGLDPELRHSFYNIVRELEDDGVSVILSSHALTELEAHTRKIAILRKGHLIAAGTLGELRDQANLPIHIRLNSHQAAGFSDIASSLPAGITQRPINGHAIELALPPTRKVEMLRYLVGNVPEFDDLDITQPTLADLYLHFQNRSTPS
ncbi:ABC transporter ATP-binding protein [Thalassospira mesophila]|uniref:ABC transporter ATP-binding protein n=1 Tax=Thalassospira mesophila TaxID=1293891 RepID=A0A1Y2KVT9_9PROT|nr:ABC transporter ATP-binding protein [Thalassospira mesophila]OSQ36003.1 ABC transporter ATP-binding protein [Thalassospira mesophila]